MNSLLKIIQLLLQFCTTFALVQLMSEYEYGLYALIYQVVSIITLLSFSPLTLYSLNKLKDRSLMVELLKILAIGSFFTAALSCISNFVLAPNHASLFLYAVSLIFCTNWFQAAMSYFSVRRSISGALLVAILYYATLLALLLYFFLLELKITSSQYIFVIIILQTILPLLIFQKLLSKVRFRYLWKKFIQARVFISGQVIISGANWLAFQLPKLCIVPLFGITDYGEFMKVMFLPVAVIGAIEVILHTTFLPRFFRNKSIGMDEKSTDFMLFVICISTFGCVGLYFSQALKDLILPQNLNTQFLLSIGFGIELNRAVVNYTIIDGYRDDMPHKHYKLYIYNIILTLICMLISIIHHNLILYCVTIFITYFACSIVFSYFTLEFSKDEKVLFQSVLFFITAPLLGFMGLSSVTWFYLAVAVLLCSSFFLSKSKWLIKIIQIVNYN